MPACSLLLADDLASEPRVIVVREDAEAPRRDDAAPASADGAPDGAPDVEAGVTDPTLIGWWSFDDATGATVPDLSGHGHEAILMGDTVISKATAHAGGAAVVSGAGARINVPTLAGAAFPRTGTLSIWFRWEQMETSDHVGVFDLYATERSHVFLRHANEDPAGVFQFALQASGPVDYPFSAGFGVPSKTWAHVVLTWDEAAEQARLLVDGALVQTGSYKSAFAPTEQLFQLGVDLHGAIDEVRLYSRALDPGEASLLP